MKLIYKVRNTKIVNILSIHTLLFNVSKQIVKPLFIVEVALQNISMFFRSEPKWEVVEPAPDIGSFLFTKNSLHCLQQQLNLVGIYKIILITGTRIRKQYFIIKDKAQPKEKFVLSWVSNI